MKTDGTERTWFAELEYGTGRSYDYHDCQLYFLPRVKLIGARGRLKEKPM